jgi:hypothetical protein
MPQTATSGLSFHIAAVFYEAHRVALEGPNHKRLPGGPSVLDAGGFFVVF